MQAYTRILILGFTLLYVCFPTSNSSSDALGYASYPEIGVHHLLYDWLCTLVVAITNSHENALFILKIINSLVAGAVLFLVSRFLKKSSIEQGWIWILFIGSSFGFMRFAVENETYIIPILFSLAGTLHLLECESGNRYSKLILAFLFFAIAVLFHQIHLMWFLAASLALLIKKGLHIRNVLIPSAGIVFVLFIYYLNASFLHMSFIHFFTGVLDGETVQLKPGLDNFKFTAINFIRTFIQVHGIIPLLYKKYILVSWTLYISFACIFAAGIFKILSLNNLQKSELRLSHTLALNTILFAFIFHFVFAWYSVGNAEFMAMLPILLALWVALQWKINMRVVLLSAIGMFLWNSTTALIPDHFLNYQNTREAVMNIEKRGGYFIAYDKIQLENYYKFMHNNDNDYSNEIFMNVSKSPAEHTSEVQKTMHIRLQKMLSDSIYVRTDCVGHPSPTNRKSLLQKQTNERFFASYKLVKIDSYDCFYGRVYINRVLGK